MKIKGTIQYVDLGAGEFYLVTDTSRLLLEFDFGNTKLYSELQRLAALEKTVCVNGDFFGTADTTEIGLVIHKGGKLKINSESILKG